MLTFENVLKIFQEYLLRDPEELFDILLSDFQDFAMIYRTRGTPGGHRGGRKGRRGTMPAISGLAEGGAEMRAVLFILKLGLKILAAPVVLARLPMAAAWLVGKVQDLRYAIQDAVYG